MNDEWTPTHRIEHQQQVVLVMVYDGVPYTREEWRDFGLSDYAILSDGSWVFQGEPFEGTVQKITG